MKRVIIIVSILLIGFSASAQKKKELLRQLTELKEKNTDLENKLKAIEEDKELNLNDSLQNLSYSFGLGIGNNLKTIGFDSISYNALVMALKDGIKGTEKISLEEAQNRVRTTMQALEEMKAKKQKAKGKKFLSENGQRPEVTTIESGLQYEVLKKGEGSIPVASDKVKVHYTGMLIDGTVFDSSVERGEPTTFGVTQVIQGWQEALQLMPVGSKWKVYVPEDIAYGERGAGGGMIPPYATLIFEIELLAIEN